MGNVIVVKVELWPDGEESQNYRLATIRITDDNTGGHLLRNYDVELLMPSGMVKKTARMESYQPQVAINMVDDAFTKLNLNSEERGGDDGANAQHSNSPT